LKNKNLFFFLKTRRDSAFSSRLRLFNYRSAAACPYRKKKRTEIALFFVFKKNRIDYINSKTKRLKSLKKSLKFKKS